MQSMNKLPIRTYVRQRVSTSISGLAGLSSGTVQLNLSTPSDVGIVLVCDPGADPPLYVVAAIGRTPTMTDFDMVTSPVSADFVKPQSLSVIHLPAMQTDLRWAAFNAAGAPAAFSETGISRLVVTVDQ